MRQPSKQEGTPEPAAPPSQAYQGALEAVFAIVIAMGDRLLGRRKLGTEPWWSDGGYSDSGSRPSSSASSAMRRMVEEAGADGSARDRARRKRRKEGE